MCYRVFYMKRLRFNPLLFGSILLSTMTFWLKDGVCVCFPSSVLEKSEFKDDSQFFRFYADEETEGTSTKNKQLQRSDFKLIENIMAKSLVVSWDAHYSLWTLLYIVANWSTIDTSTISFSPFSLELCVLVISITIHSWSPSPPGDGGCFDENEHL